jgi:hypothetical protein
MFAEQGLPQENRAFSRYSGRSVHGQRKGALAVKSAELLTEILLPVPKERGPGVPKFRMRPDRLRAYVGSGDLTGTKKGTIGAARSWWGCRSSAGVADEAAKPLVGKAPDDVIGQ